MILDVRVSFSESLASQLTLCRHSEAWRPREQLLLQNYTA